MRMARGGMLEQAQGDWKHGAAQHVAGRGGAQGVVCETRDTRGPLLKHFGPWPRPLICGVVLGPWLLVLALDHWPGLHTHAQPNAQTYT